MNHSFTDRDLVIQGILKEALLHQVAFEAIVDDEVITLFIESIQEESLRGASDTKLIHMIALYGSDRFSEGQTYKLNARFFRHNIEAEVELVAKPGQNLVFKLPKKLLLQNSRESNRHPIKSEFQKPIPVIIHSELGFCEGALRILDTSNDGFGAKLVIPNTYKLSQGAIVKGRLQKKDPLFEIVGKLVSFERVASSGAFYTEYRIGLVQIADPSRSAPPQDRSQTRVAGSLKLEMQSIAFQQEKLQVTTQDISISGFSGTMNKAELMTPIGSFFRIVNCTSVAKLVHRSASEQNMRLHFHVSHPDEQAAIEWMKLITPFYYPGAKAEIQDYRDLYRIFFQAGAVSSQYIVRHQHLQNLLIDEEAIQDVGSQSSLRWYIHDETGMVQGHIASTKLSDRLWMVGDAAKSDSSAIRLTEAIRAHFKVLNELLNALGTRPNVLAYWSEGHPNWKNWERALQTDGTSVLAKTQSYYFRTVPNINRTQKWDLNLSITDSIEFDSSCSTLQKFVDCIVAPNTNFETQKSTRLIRLSAERKDFFAVALSKPDGLSINRVADTIFLFSGSPSSDFSSELAQKIAIDVSKLLGESFSNVRLFSAEKPKEGVAQTTFLLKPKGLLLL